jgi:hypothetical protein
MNAMAMPSNVADVPVLLRFELRKLRMGMRHSGIHLRLPVSS